MTHTKGITKTALTLITLLLIAYAITAVVSGQPNPMAWPFWGRSIVVLLAALGTALLNRIKA